MDKRKRKRDNDFVFKKPKRVKRKKISENKKIAEYINEFINIDGIRVENNSLKKNKYEEECKIIENSIHIPNYQKIKKIPEKDKVSGFNIEVDSNVNKQIKEKIQNDNLKIKIEIN